MDGVFYIYCYFHIRTVSVKITCSSVINFILHRSSKTIKLLRIKLFKARFVVLTAVFLKLQVF